MTFAIFAIDMHKTQLTMKRILSLIAIVFVSCTMMFGQGHLKIKNIPIDGTVQSMYAKLKATGLKPIPEVSGALQGTFAGMNDCAFLIIGSEKTNTVYKVGVMSQFEDSWYSLKSLYLRLKEQYTNKYNECQSFEFFSSPYYEGDGYEMLALRLDKCTYASYFETPEGIISIEIKEKYIFITYEDAINLEKAKAELNESVNSDI